jgi:glycosyltransferase involved in cell wall biosynthesis
MEWPLVSVIIPIYNGERYLAAALQSAFTQDYQSWEIIVVDDGSTDGGARLVPTAVNVRYIRQENQGVAAARNVGIIAAQGEYLAFLDQDDLWEPDKVRLQVDYLLRHPQVGYVIVHERLMLEPGVDAPSWLKTDLLARDHPAFVPSALMTRQSTFDRVGMFDQRYRMGSDSDWFFRAKDLGVPMSVLPQTLLIRRIHDRNHSAQTSTATREMLQIARASLDRQRTRPVKSARPQKE